MPTRLPMIRRTGWPTGRLPETHITPKSGWPSLDLGDLWKCRDLIGQLTLRNIRVR